MFSPCLVSFVLLISFIVSTTKTTKPPKIDDIAQNDKRNQAEVSAFSLYY